MTVPGIRRRGVDPAVLQAARALDIDETYLRELVETLTAIGSSPLGFRTTGTPEDAAVADVVAAEMRSIGLRDVAVETVEVDAWRFLFASVTVPGSATVDAVTYRAVSFGGVPPTPTQGVSGRLVDVRDGLRRRTAGQDLSGAIVLLDWRREDVHPSAVVLELAGRGVLGVIVNCPAGAGWYQSEQALGGFDGHWPAGMPPMILVSKEDATRLRAAATAEPTVVLTLQATLTKRADGHNVVGYLPGSEPTAGPIVVGAHHDAWFQGAFDNTSGVAAMLGLARALVRSGTTPRHTLCFTSRTAEEYGIAESAYDWCIGAWGQVQSTHPQWQHESPFHLCVEATGHRALRSVIEAPVELAAWAGRVGRAAAREGWTPTGWRVSPPVAGTEQWPFLVSGVPGVACYAWEREFGRTDYHTQHDTIELLDFGVLSAQSHLYALLLLDADRDPDGILDHGARARQLESVAAEMGHEGLAQAASRHGSVTGRKAFTGIGTGLFALDAHSALSLPHEQLRADVTALQAGLAALAADDHAGAGKALRSVGSHHLVTHLGKAAFDAHVRRYAPEALTRTWAGSSHLTGSENIWPEVACLTRQPGAEAFGPWVEAGLRRAEAATRIRLNQRLDAMTRSLIRASDHEPQERGNP